MVAKQRYLFGGGAKRLYPWLLLLPGLGIYLLIAVGPALATAFYSFTDATGLGGAVNWIGLDNYERFFAGCDLQLALDLCGSEGKAADNVDVIWRTLRFMVLVTVIQFGIGLLMAVLVNQKLRGRMIFRTVFFLPVILGAVVQGLVWKLFLSTGAGPMDSIFGWFGWEDRFLQGPNAFYWVVMVQIWANAGFTMVVFLAGMQTIPADLYEAAAVDGARGWKLFRHITWPQLTPAVNTNFLLNIIGSLQAWILFLILIGYRPGTQVLGYVVYAEGFAGQGTGASFRQGYAASASMVLFLLVMVLGMTANFVVTRRERKYLG